MDNNLRAVFFDANIETGEMKSVMVGILGCTEIKEKYYGKDTGGIEIYGYVAKFENGTQKNIDTAILSY